MPPADKVPVLALRAAAIAAHAARLAERAEAELRDLQERRDRSLVDARETVQQVLGIHVSDVQFQEVPQLVMGGWPVWTFTRDGLVFRVRLDNGGDTTIELRTSRLNGDAMWLRVRDLEDLGSLISEPGGAK